MKARVRVLGRILLFCSLFPSIVYLLHIPYILLLLSILTYISSLLAVFRHALSCTLLIPSLLFNPEIFPITFLHLAWQQLTPLLVITLNLSLFVLLLSFFCLASCHDIHQ